MPIQLSNLWQWQGRVSRSAYLLAGLIGCAIKFLLDRATSSVFFHRQIHLADYWQPLGAAARLKYLSRPEINWLTVLLLTALPFIYIGLTMTVRRLRDIAYPAWLAVLFFVPVGNLFFFLLLSCIPSAERWASNPPIRWTPRSSLRELMPESEFRSGFVAVILSTLLGVGASLGLTTSLRSYGWSLFLALPFCMGLFAALLYSARERRAASHCMLVSVLPIFLVGFVLLGIASEGVICLLMAAPIAGVLALFGGWLGYVVQEGRWSVYPQNPISKSSLCAVLIASAVGRYRTRRQPCASSLPSAILHRN